MSTADKKENMKNRIVEHQHLRSALHMAEGSRTTRDDKTTIITAGFDLYGTYELKIEAPDTDSTVAYVSVNSEGLALWFRPTEQRHWSRAMKDHVNETGVILLLQNYVEQNGFEREAPNSNTWIIPSI